MPIGTNRISFFSGKQQRVVSALTVNLRPQIGHLRVILVRSRILLKTPTPYTEVSGGLNNLTFLPQAVWNQTDTEKFLKASLRDVLRSVLSLR